MGLLDRIALSTLPLMPTGLMRRLSSRYIAGETLDSALSRLDDLAAAGFLGALDILGEDVTTEDEARSVARDYAEAAERMKERGLDAYISVKPTHLGLRVSETLALELYAGLVRHVESLGMFCRVEMEDHTTTDATLRIFEELRPIAPDHVGIVLQSRLFRTPADIAALGEGRVHVRMVKGIYLEPESLAHTRPEPIRDAYLECARRLWERGSSVALATHDELMAERLVAATEELGVGKDSYEFQVLLGVRQPLWESWREEGHPVRVYVPYGPNWRAYSTRRLKKNPEIFRHVMRDLLRR